MIHRPEGMNLRFVAHLTGLTVLAVGAGILLSAGVSLLYGDDDVPALLVSAAAAVVAGLPMYLTTRLRGQQFIGYREGFLAVGLGWMAAMIFGAVPYVAYGTFGIIDALFESMSGFTTTGASVLVDYNQPHGLLFWRSLTHWYGGMGIVVLFIAVLPSMGAGAMKLFSAESPGPVPERLTPRIRDTARNLWLIYVGMTVAQSVALIIAGMPIFDAVTHSFGSMATGGFSPRATSVAAFNNVTFELIIAFFMFLAGGNFALYFAALRGDPLRLFRSREWRLYAAIAAGSIVAIAISLMIARSHFSVGHALREATFQVISVQSTTGFVSADFDKWNTLAKLILVLLMVIGGCAGSTAGGFKVARLLVLLKSTRHELTRQMHPQAVLPLRAGNQVISEVVRVAVLQYFALYMIIWATGSLLVAATGTDLITAATSVVATFNNIGPGLGPVGATMNYAFLQPFAKCVLIAMMVIGRLELFAILLPFTRGFWRG
ncbi:MAG: Trk system potassium uptake protein TrkG [Actinobacteria bacterium ADurb.Bin444]|nr:MAG: Trk system potassium uptake protein TrkG [Actinobacteria bacterium ADurb.Bin444]